MYNVASLFAGVGGIDIGFSQTGDFNVIYANEFDKNAQKTFGANFSNDILDKRDIHEVDPVKGRLGENNVDVVLAGFPCQPFSIAGYRRGLEDERGDLFFEALRIIKEKKPRVVFLENVKNLVTHDHGNTFKVIREYLVHSGYYIKWKVLNAKDYGNIPQNRERIYVVGFKNENEFEKFQFPDKVSLTTKLTDIIDFDSVEDEKYYYRSGKQPFYEELAEHVVDSSAIYQWRRQYVRKNMSGVIPTLTANMGTGGHNVPIIRTHDGQIRKLTPRETFNAQGYPRTYVLPSEMSNSALYKEAGNSVVIPVIKRIAEQIDAALSNEQDNQSLPDTRNKLSLVYTHMIGRMEGVSYSMGSFDDRVEMENFIHQNHQENKLQTVEFYDDESFFKAVKHGGDNQFFTVIG